MSVPVAVEDPGVHLFAAKMYFPVAGPVQVAMTVSAVEEHTVVTYCVVVGSVHVTAVSSPVQYFPAEQGWQLPPSRYCPAVHVAALTVVEDRKSCRERC